MNRKILVTGGAGFIGSNFIHYLLRRKSELEITVLDSMTYAANEKSLPKKGYKLIKGSIQDSKLVDKLVSEHDIVVNFAAESHNDNSISNPFPFIETNVVGTFHLLQAVRNHNRRLHHISTDEVYGDLELDDPTKFHETTAYDPSSPYSASKACSDHLVRAWVRTFGVKATISNCSNNYGPRQHVEKFIPRQITNVLIDEKPKLYGNGENVRDWIHVDDHNSAVMAIIERGTIGETYLIGADSELNNKTVLKKILEIMNKPQDWFDHVTDRPGHDMRYAINANKLRGELSWKPKYTNFDTGIKATVNWYRDNEDWWKPLKQATEVNYKKSERIIK